MIKNDQDSPPDRPEGKGRHSRICVPQVAQESAVHEGDFGILCSFDMLIFLRRRGGVVVVVGGVMIGGWWVREGNNNNNKQTYHKQQKTLTAATVIKTT